MSLKDPDEDINDLVPEKRKGKLGGAAAKSKMLLFALIVGLILGGFAMHYFVEPMLKEAASSTCKDCLATKELLGKENDCLYSLVPDAKAAIASCTNQAYVPETQTEPAAQPATGSDTNAPSVPDTNTGAPGDNEVS
jgi:hypothetical protein